MPLRGLDFKRFLIPGSEVFLLVYICQMSQACCSCLPALFNFMLFFEKEIGIINSGKHFSFTSLTLSGPVYYFASIAAFI